MPFALLFAAFALVLDMLHAVTRGQRDRGVEVVVLRQQVRMYQRQAKRTPLCWPFTRSDVIFWQSGHRSARIWPRME